MEDTVLNAIERTNKQGRCREVGFISGVIYGDSVTGAVSVKFEEAALKKILKKHGSHAKVWVNHDNNKKFGFVKEIQRDPVTAKIIHIDVQLVSKAHQVKLQLPINFKGQDILREKQLQLQIYKPEIDVFGRMDLMPEVIDINVSDMELGYSITFRDFNLDKEIRIVDKEDESYGGITHIEEKATVGTDEAETSNI